jgi:hypothetical protein
MAATRREKMRHTCTVTATNHYQIYHDRYVILGYKEMSIQKLFSKRENTNVMERSRSSDRHKVGTCLIAFAYPHITICYLLLILTHDSIPDT